MANSLGSVHGNIRIEYDSRGIARARNDLGQFVSLSALATATMGDNDRASKKLSISLGLLGKGFLLMTKYVTITATAIQTLITSINVVGAILTALAPIIGATLATLPGIIFAAVASLVVLKTAFAGVGDAIKAAASGDIDKMNEAIKKLAPNARAFVVALADAFKQLKPVQQAIQNAFFAGLAQQIPGVVAALKQVQGQATGLSAAFGGVAKQLLAFASSPQFILATQASLKGVANLLNILAPALLPVLEGFAQMARNAAELAVSINGNLLPAAQRLGEFLSKFDLRKAFADGMAALQPLITIVTNFGIIVGTIVKQLGAFNESGNAILGTTGQVLQTLAQFIQTDAATKALQALGLAFNAISGAVGDVLLAALQAIAPVLTALAPLFTVLARVLGNVLTNAVQVVAPILLKLAEALDGALGPILPAIAEALGSVVNALGPLLALLAAQLQPLLIALAPIIEQAAKNIGVMLVSAVEQLIPPLTDLLPTIVQLVQDVGPSLVQLMAAMAEGFAAAAPLMLLMVNILVGALVPVLKVMIPVLAFVISALASLAGWLAGIIAPIAAFIGKWTEASKITGLIQSVFGFVVNTITSAINIARAAVGGGIASIQAAFGSLTALVGQVATVFGNIRAAIASSISQAVNTVRSLPGQIAGAIGNLSGLLFGAGQDVIGGLVNGIRSAAGRVAAAARDAVAGIPGVIKNLLGISSPSKVTRELGRETGRGLALGIVDTADLVKRAMEDATKQLVSTVPVVSFNASNVNAAVTASATPKSPTPPASPVIVQGGGGTTVNTVVNAPQNMSPDEVAQAATSKIVFALNMKPGR